MIFYASHPFRWHPNVCRECCCWFSLNSAIFPSCEACRQRAHVLDSEDIGYVLSIKWVSGEGGWGFERWREGPLAGRCVPGCICQCMTFPCV